MTHILQTGDAAAGQRVAVHDAGVELYRADGVAQAAEADRMDLGIVLDRLRAGQGGVEGGLVGLQQRRGGLHRGLSERPGGDDHEIRHDLLLQG